MFWLVAIGVVHGALLALLTDFSEEEAEGKEGA